MERLPYCLGPMLKHPKLVICPAEGMALGSYRTGSEKTSRK